MRNVLLSAIESKFRKTLTFLMGLLLISGFSFGQAATVTQTEVSSVSAGATDQLVIGISITIGNDNNKDVTRFDISEIGTAVGTTDITNAQIWCTGETTTFTSPTLFGSQTISSSFSITGVYTISKNTTTYYWLTFDVASGATTGRTLDASCTNIIFDGSSIIPSPTSPAGSRTIAATASLSSSTATLTGFNYTEGSGPSASQTFNVSGTDLDGSNVVLTAPTNYEISSDDVSFSGSLTLTAFDGTSTTIYVRLKSGLTNASSPYNGESISIAGGGATTINVSNDGAVSASGGSEVLLISEVADPTDVWEGRFVELYNSGTSTIDFSSEIWYLGVCVNGGTTTSVQLTGTIAAGATFVIAYNATDFNTQYGFAPDQNWGTVNGNGDDSYHLYKGGDHSTGTLVDIYGVIGEDGTGKTWEYLDSRAVRNCSTSPNATWTAGEWTITSANVADMDPGTHCAVATPTLTLSTTTLSGFTYVVGSGPSTSQSFNLSGSDLDGTSVTVTAPTNYEISDDDATFGASVNVNYTAPTLVSTPLYVRLKTGLAENTYNSEVITCNDNGTAANVTVTCDGEVTAVVPPASNETITIMNYNILNYVKNAGTGLCDQTNNDFGTKGTYMKTIIGYATPDVLGVEEMQGGSGGQADADEMHDSLLNILDASPGYNSGDWARLPYSSTMNNEFISSQLYWNTNKFTWISTNWVDISGCAGCTSRDVPVVQLRFYKNDNLGNPIDLYVMVAHLTPSSGAANEAIRASETAFVRAYLDANLNSGKNMVLMGDFNMYHSTEVGYQNLVSGGVALTDFNDPINRPGSWATNSSFQDIHTQCTRILAPGDCGATGGSDDRFDFILLTDNILSGTNKVSYVSYETIGQDGLHYNDDINNGSNASAPATVITALYNNSDHLPVKCDLEFEVGATLLASVSSLTGFYYEEGSGPSAEQSFDLSGSGLDGTDVIITAPTNYEVSKTSGGTFAGSQTYTAFDGTSTTIYVRLKSGLTTASSPYNETLTISGGGATNITIDLEGTVAASGTIGIHSFEASGDTWTPATLSTPSCSSGGDVWDYVSSLSSITPNDGSLFWGMSDVTGNCGTSPETYALPNLDVSGYNTITLSFDYFTEKNWDAGDELFYEIFLDDVGQGSVQFVTGGDGTTDQTDAWVTVNESIPDGTNDVRITFTATQNGGDYGGLDFVRVVGTPDGPALTTSVASLTGYTYEFGSGPSTSQSFDLSGSLLDGTQVTVSAGTNYEVSLDNSSFSNSVNVSYTAPDLSATTIYVRLKSGLAVNTYNSVLVTCSDNGTATDVTVSNDGEVTCQPQTITFNALANKTYGDADFGLTATASSGLSVSYLSSNASVATISGSTVTIVGAGTTTITASQAGNSSYCAATDVDQTLTIDPKALTVTSADANDKTYDGTNAAVVVGTLSGIVGADDVSLVGTGTFASVNAGTGISVTSTSTLAGTDAGNYTLTQPTGLSADIIKATQTITFGALADVTTATADYDPGATSSVGLSITYTSDDPSVATIVGGNIHVVGVGTCNITASQPGDANAFAATPVVQSLTVNLASSTADDIIISELCDPQNEYGTDRYVEIYNPTSTSIDLTNCELEIWVNGGYLYTFSLNGTIGSCTALSYGDVGSVNYTPDVAEAWSTVSFNGGSDDGAKFKNSIGTVVDVAIGTAHVNSSLIRNSNISTPNTTFTAGEWTVTAATDAGVGGSTPSSHISDACSGPMITLSDASLTGFTYVEGSGPSAEQTFTVEGSNLTADITLTPPTNYEISESSGSGFGSSITLTQSGGSVATTTIYIRLKAGLSVATYNSEDITATSTSATSKTVTCNGEVTSTSAPISIVYQGFEVDPATPPDTWSYTPSGTVTESTDRSHVGSQSGKIDGVGSVTLANTDISGYEDVILSVAYSCSGADSGDDLYLDISYDNGSTWTGTGSVKLVDGFGNANIAFGVTNGLDPTTVASNPWTVNIDNAETQISVRLRTVGSSAGDIYYIDDLKLDGVVSTTDPEPTNHATAFSCGTTSYNSINFTWTDAITGTQAPDQYLILCNTSGTFSDPVDGTPQSDSEGSIANIAHGTQSVTFTGLSASTTYYFKVFPYTNFGANIDYKIDATPLTGNCSTTAPPDVFISEIAGYGMVSGTFNNEYIELINRESSAHSLDGWQLLYYENGSLEETLTFGSSHSIPANDAFVVAARSSNTISEDYLASFSINGSNCYVVLKDPDGVIYDEVGSSSDVFDCDYNYEFTQCDDDNKPVANWDNLSETDGTPGVVNCISCILPTAAATSLNFTSIENSEMTLDWTNGDGFRRIVIAREGAAVSFSPANTNTYEANSVFSDGTDLGSGNICVYNGTGSTVTVTGLSGATEYHYAIFEYSCLPGSELYYSTSLTGNQATSLSPVTDLDVVCQTNTTATIEWTAPTGDYTGVVIGIRNSALTPHAVSGDATTYTADVIFGDGWLYGSTDPRSYVVYNGSGTSVTVTGLTAGQPYTLEAYTYKNNTSSIWSDTHPTTSITALGTSDVANQIVLADNAQVQLQWNAPDAGCYDEVLIVGNNGAAITTQPTGDGSSYTGNLAFGSGDSYGTGYVVYKGDFSPQTVTGLTNGDTYCFTWFVRSGTTWSQGVSACGIPEEITILLPGDLAIVAVNTLAGSGSMDEICFFSFKDITTGTAIDFTDNGYERLDPDEWADSEGTIRLTRTGADIPAGQVICFQGQGYQSADFDMFTCGSNDNAGWTVTSLNGTGSYDLNVDDQIWIMQGGSWDNGGSLNNHDAYYSGNVLYGWTATGWKPNPGYDDTKGSTVFSGLECFNTDVTVNANHEKVKYIGPLTNATQFEWLSRINDNSNWWGYADNATYNAVSGYDYSGDCITFDIGDLISIGSAGVWTGTAGEDWFDCSNWENLRVPNGSVDVVVTGAVGNFITIDDGIASVPEAECNNLTIYPDAVVGPFDIVVDVNHTDAVLNIYGDMTNDQVLELTDGEIHFMDDFTNNDTYTHTAGTAFFDGSAAQALTGTAEFYNLTIGNTSTGLTVNNDITVNNILTLTDGIITSGANSVIVDNDVTTSISGHTSDSYVYGMLRRKVAATGSYDLPVGDASYYQLANINLTTSTIDYLDAQFTDTHVGTTLPNSPYITVDTEDITELLDNGFWTISPVTGDATSYDVTLTSTGHTNGGAAATDHTIIKRTNAAGAWTAYDANHDDATQSGSGSSPITAELTAMSGFSDFLIAKKQQNTLPVELLFFDAYPENRAVILNWETASEANNDYYNIERSSDGITFNSITRVIGAGNSSDHNQYRFIDEKPLGGLSYYRLKQVDYNGIFSYSKIESVQFNKSTDLNIFSIQDPNYAATLIVENAENSDLTLCVTDMSGKIIYSENMFNVDGQFSVRIEKSRLSPGIYIFHVYNKHKKATEKVVVF
jgi:endonuclease/exonuclease/phosphatase family metal-dependent hydrolase